jgi:hypothetical protein
LQAAASQSGENKYQLAERYLLEALPIFREHYKEDNIAIAANECKLAYAQAMQNKFAEAETHYRICADWRNKSKDESINQSLKQFITPVEEVFSANNRKLSN